MVERGSIGGAGRHVGLGRLVTAAPPDNSAAIARAWAWTVRWLEMQGGTVLAAQVVTVMQSRLRQEMAK